MKKFVLVILSFALVLHLGESFDFHGRDLESDDSLWDLYERWRSHHTVSRSIDEKHKRFNVFKANTHYVHNFNKKDKPYKLKLNKFADMTNHEFRSVYSGSKVRHHRMLQGSLRGNVTFMYENVQSVPPTVDWRNKGSVTGVKDQGQCGKISVRHISHQITVHSLAYHSIKLKLDEANVSVQSDMATSDRDSRKHVILNNP